MQPISDSSPVLAKGRLVHYHEWKWNQITMETIATERPATRSLKVPFTGAIPRSSRSRQQQQAAEYQASAYIAERFQTRKKHCEVVSDVLEGPTSTTCNFCNYVVGKNAFPPEDIALRAAEAVAIFQATLEGTNPIIGPWDVLTIAEHWRAVCANLSPSFAQALPGTGVCEREQRSIANVEAALGSVVSTLNSLKEELGARVENALSGKKQRDLEERERRVFVVKSLSEINVRSLLSQYNDPGPIFAVAGNVDLIPRIADCKMSALDCKCHVPWHERDLWERRAFSQYKLPPPTSLWQSQSLKLPGGINETIWVQQGAAREIPGNLFSLGTIPQAHRASHGRELLSGGHLRAMFHACWTNWRWEEEEDDSATGGGEGDEEMEEEEQEQSEEEEEAEEAEEESEEDSCTAEYENWPWQIDFNGPNADDPASDGCLWMHVLWWLSNGRRGRHVVEGMHYLNFADMWNFIMREPTILVPFEGLCRMEAAAHLRPALPAHEWSSWVLKDSAEAEDRAQLHAMEPGFASSSRESDQQKVAAQRWLRRQVNEEANRRLDTGRGRGSSYLWTLTGKLPLDNGSEDDSATGGEEGDEEDEEEEAEPQEEETDDELDAETEDDSLAGCVTPTGNEGHVECLCRTPEKVNRRKIESPQEVGNLSDKDCGSFDESSDECF